MVFRSARSPRRLVFCAAILTLCAGSLVAQQPAATLIDIQPGDAPALMDALKSSGLAATGQDASSSTFNGRLVVLEAKGALSPATIAGLKTFVQQGGSLLIGLDKHPGPAAVQLAFLSPTMAWSTQAEAISRPLVFIRIATGKANAELFGSAPFAAFTVPYFFPIRPVSVAERGPGRYDRYQQKTTSVLFNHPAGEFFWTRPLLDRDWRVALTANDRAESPLLITGHYGAGRVAVFASTLTGDGQARETFWKQTLAWLTTPPPASTAEPATDAITMSQSVLQTPAGGDAMHVTLKNRTGQPLSLQVIGRILTWEQAYIGDSLQPIGVPANGSASVDIPLPKPGPTGIQALDWQRAFVVRVGVLSQSGATLLKEGVVHLDLTPSTGIELTTDDLYRVVYPYPNAPGVDGFPMMQNRMGMPVDQYAYPPSSTVHATATFSNGVHNIAASAQVADETTPGNPSLVAIDDAGARYNKGPRGDVFGYATWNGEAGKENVIRFHFATPMTVSEVTLLGSPDGKGNKQAHNPGAIAIECDGHAVLKKSDLDARFASDDGLVHLAFAPVQTTDLVVRLPWLDTLPDNSSRQAPSLGEIEIAGSAGPLPPELHGEAMLVLRDAMTQQETIVGTKSISVPPGGQVAWTQAFQLPAAPTAFYRLEARFAGQTRSLPILAIQPAKTLASVESERPSSAPMASFVTTKGFRGAFPVGTGTRDQNSAWETPDDEVWAYSHQVKQIDASRRSWASWLYVTGSNMGHYSTPWGLFDNGEILFKLATPVIVESLKRQRGWATSSKVILGFGDRWDSGPNVPSLYGWPELVAFDEYLRANGKPGLAGQTHDELNRDVNQNHAGEWAVWHEHRYVDSVELLRTSFAADGKRLTMSGQGIPMASNADAAILARSVKGMSSDNTWGMEQESVSFTTGRQLADQAFNPEWQLGFNMVWGYDDAVLDNMYWYSPVSTTEASRRHWYDSAWRGLVQQDGSYGSSFALGYNNNGGDAWTVNGNDYRQGWIASERFSLIYPEAPLGAGLMVSSSPVDSPTSTLFNGGGMGPVSTSEALVDKVASTFERLHDAGLSIPFSGNILGVNQSTHAAPLILYDVGTASPEELAALKSLAARGSRIACFASSTQLAPDTAALFGLTPDGTVAQAKPVGIIAGRPLLENGNLLYIPIEADALSPELSLELAPILQRWLNLPIAFPEGTMGYGFLSGGRTFVVVEDWLEKPREVAVRIHAASNSAHAISLNDHAPLEVRRDGSDWLVTLPLRAGDGEVIVLEQGKAGAR
jgi:hypothetical protein